MFKLIFGTHQGQAGYLSYVDMNHDGMINTRDMIFVERCMGLQAGSLAYTALVIRTSGLLPGDTSGGTHGLNLYLWKGRTLGFCFSALRQQKKTAGAAPKAVFLYGRFYLCQIFGKCHGCVLVAFQIQIVFSVTVPIA